MSVESHSELQVGPDKVRVSGDEVIIRAKRAMVDWTVREFCCVPIYFNGDKYFLLRKTAASLPYAIEYTLAPWHSDLGAESSRSIVYDEAYVAHRDAQFRSERRHERIYPALMCFYPLLGLCWSRFKAGVLGPLGFEPVAVTGASVMLLFAFWMAEGVFVCYFRLGFLALVFSRLWLLWVDYALFLLLPVDCALRYGKILEGEEAPPGFLEWAYKLLFRKS